MAIRQSVLANEPRCAQCLKQGKCTPATQVDHIKPLSLGGDDSFSNLQGLCDSCHDTKTRKDMGWRDVPVTTNEWLAG